LDAGGNYGVLCGKGGLVVLDYDSEELKKALAGKLPKTFRVKTRKGWHDYYLVEKAVAKHPLTNKKGEQLGDLQGARTQVVGPGSTHPSGAKYELEVDAPIAKLTARELHEVLEPFLNASTPAAPAKPKPAPKRHHASSPSEAKLAFKRSIDMREVARKYLNWEGSGNAVCPWHDDKNASLTINKTTAYCHACKRSFDLFDFMKRFEGASTFKDQTLRASEVFGVPIPSGFLREMFEEKRTLDFNNKHYLARAIIKRWPVYFDEHGLWWRWVPERFSWEQTDEHFILGGLSEEFRDYNKDKITYQAKTKTQLLTALQQQSRLPAFAPKEPKKSWVQFGSRVYDLETGEDFEATPEYFLTQAFPHEVGENEDCPTIDELFKDWAIARDLKHRQSGESWVATLYDLLAYFTLPEQTEQIVTVLLGTGRNGKTKYLELVEAFLGKDNVAWTDFDSLTERFGSAVLYKRKLGVVSETDAEIFFNKKKGENLMKRLSGDSKMSFEFKGKDQFQEEITSKIVIPTNNLPLAKCGGDSFYRRFMVVDFPNQFKITPHLLERIPPEEYNALAKKVLRLARELWNGRQITNLGDFQERKKRYQARANLDMPRFIAENCEIDSRYNEKWSRFFEHFKYWLGGDHKDLTANHASRILNTLEGGAFSERQNLDCEDGKKQRHIIGLRLKRAEPVRKGASDKQADLASSETHSNSAEQASSLLLTKPRLSDALNQGETIKREELTDYNDQEIERAIKTGELRQVKPGVLAK